VVFGTIWTDYHFEFGSVNQAMYLAERYPGAFDRLKTPCYVHRVDASLFARDPRLGTRDEFICRDPVDVISREEVNAYEEIKKSRIRLIEYKKDLRPAARIPRALMGKIHAVYAPVDIHWKPKIGTDHPLVYFDTLEEIPGLLQAADRPVVLVGNPIDLFHTRVAFGDVAKKYLVLPSIAANWSAKTTDAEYKKYLAARTDQLAGWEIITI
jgi:hypothetical protein